MQKIILYILLLVFLMTACVEREFLNQFDPKVPIPKFYLHENEVTCLCPDTKPGDKGLIDGVEFESVNNQLIRERRDEGVDMTKLCTSLVTDMSEIFMGFPDNPSSFNQPIGNWDVSNVTNMRGMFQFSVFNQELENWDVGNVTDMSLMFGGSLLCSDCKNKFNQPIKSWAVGNVTDISWMFGFSDFNQALGEWDVSNVTTMRGIFHESNFNQNIQNWNVSKVLDMSRMFSRSPFNQPINNWNTSNVMDMNSMFQGTSIKKTSFNQSINNWDVSKVENMFQMFANSQFNQSISNWDVSNVINMNSLFLSSQFNQNISKWCVTNIISEPFQFSINSPLTSENKPKWSTCQVDSGVLSQWPSDYLHCSGTPTEIVDVTNPKTGKTWMDRNLGATRAAISSSDAQAYGDLYQWGRRSDGHQCRNSATTTVLSTTDQPSNGNFIITGSSSLYDWRSPQNSNLWQGVNGVNNPCPSGYRLPTETELNAERLSWSTNTSAGAFASPLKLPMVGLRNNSSGSLSIVGTNGRYWGSTVSSSNSRNLSFNSSNASMNPNYRANGIAVRCLKD